MEETQKQAMDRERPARPTGLKPFAFQCSLGKMPLSMRQLLWAAYDDCETMGTNSVRAIPLSAFALSFVVAILFLLASGFGPSVVRAAPTAEVAKRCLRYAYIVYPYQRPGAVRMSGDRQAYFQDCMSKNGDVPPPPAPTKR
jgi:hypothetical protein